MKLKALIKQEDFDKLQDGLKELYTKQEDGTFVLEVDGSDFKARIDDFRSNNRQIIKEKEELTKKLDALKDIDPVKYAELKRIQDDMDKNEDLKLVKEGKLDEVIQRRLDSVMKSHEKEKAALSQAVKDLTDKFSTATGTVKTLSLNHNVVKSVSKIGSLRQGALDDVLNRAKSAWQVDESGTLSAKDLFNDKGAPITMDEWSAKLLQDAPYLFEKAEGGGGKGGESKGSGGGGNPKVLHNPTAADFGKKGNLEAIASGKMAVEYNQ